MSASLCIRPAKPGSTRERGQQAETLVSQYLQKEGYHILQRNLYTPFGEIDILAKYKDEFVCVEVRSRTRESTVPPELSISRAKYRHLVRSLLSLPFLHNRPTRIDLITVEAQSIRRHIKNFQL